MRFCLIVRPGRSCWIVTACICLASLLGGTLEQASAREIVPIQPAGNISPEQMKKLQEAQERAKRNAGKNQPQEEKKSEKKKDDDEKAKEDSVKTIKRPTDAPNPVDLDRPKLEPDSNGMVQFNYNGHPWAEVLQDYADAAKLSLDWQELPADYLNLMTQRKYSLIEARDLLNQHLLVRGFTILVRGEFMSVQKISKLDSSLIPRVSPDVLEDYAPYDFVRVRFQLPSSMDAAKVKEDIQLLLSPNGKATPLLATKRLLVIDAVANLRNVRNLIYDEQVAFDADEKPYFRQIKYRRADYIADQVMIVLGRDPSSRKSPMEAQVQMQKMQLLMKLDKKGKDVSKMVQPDGPPIHIVVNKRENTLLINTMKEMIPIIDRTIDQLDVPEGGISQQSFGGELSMKKYKTVSISTDTVIKTLNEIGYLDPRTQLQADSKSKTIFAQATVRDHEKISNMIDRLDGTGRKPTVIWLPPELRADQVAGSIQALIVGPEKKDDNKRRSYYWYFDNDDDEDELNDGFRVLPDVEKNRLLIWANKDELEEVQSLIDELKKTRDGTMVDKRKVRRFEARDPEETRRLLERLQESWVGENPLEIEIPSSSSEEAAEDVEATEEDADKITGVTTPSGSRNSQVFRLIQETTKTDEDKPAENKSPPIKVLVNEEGEIVIASDDTEALKNLEELMASIAPPVPEFYTFRLKYIRASTAALNLEEYFEDEIKQEDGDSFRDWYGRWRDTAPKQGPVSLGSRPPLRFVYDPRSNTVTVSNASPSQIKVIKQLIEIYDAPPESEEYYQRETETIRLKYSNAAVIAKTLKEVYRELLSSNDKEFQSKDGKSSFGGFKDSYIYAFGDARRKVYGDEIPVLFKFEGALAIGVDEVSNSLVISARAEILDTIQKTVELLDQAAVPETVVHVHEVGGLNLDADKLRRAVAVALGQPWPGGKPPSRQAAQSGGGNASRSESRGRERSRESRSRSR